MSTRARGQPVRDTALICVTGSQYEQMADVRAGAHRGNMHLCVSCYPPPPMRSAILPPTLSQNV